MKKLLCIDFDGVINNYTGNYNPDDLCKPREGVELFLKSLSNNYFIYIFTSRNTLKVEQWMCKHNLIHYISHITNIKEPAYAYIDDRAIKFNGDYDKTLTALEKFKPHWYKKSKEI